MTKRSCWDRFRYWLFKESASVDEQSQEIGRKLEDLRRAAQEFDESVKKVSQEDALRSLVISMNRAGRR